MDPESEDLKIIEHELNRLSEHFDSVHIFATRHEQGEHGGTIHFSRGSGNWFARLGQIREWLIKEDETSRISARNK